MKITYTPEAIVDLIDLFSYIHEHSLAGAARLEVRVYDRIDRLAAREFEGAEVRLRSGAIVRSWAVPPLRIYYQRLTDELLVVRVYHQARRPLASSKRTPRRRR